MKKPEVENLVTLSLSARHITECCQSYARRSGGVLSVCQSYARLFLSNIL
jgi:hypothetical protein